MAVPHQQECLCLEILYFVCELRLRQAPDSRGVKEERFGDLNEPAGAGDAFRLPVL